MGASRVTPVAMLFSRPASTLSSAAAASARAREQAWRLLAPGDRVTIVGRGAYRIVHLSEARAWVTSLEDGANRLVAAPLLRLLANPADGADQA
ncbi:hypothetical protein H7F50_00040 [Novosphingobium flavum]|nr:hypothetical protein [Novosphingobium aerophilum]